MVICLERGADLPMAQLMRLPLTVSCFSKIQIGFTFLVPVHPGSPGKKALKWVCVCVSVKQYYAERAGNESWAPTSCTVIPAQFCPVPGLVAVLLSALVSALAPPPAAVVVVRRSRAVVVVVVVVVVRRVVVVVPVIPPVVEPVVGVVVPVVVGPVIVGIVVVVSRSVVVVPTVRSRAVPAAAGGMVSSAGRFVSTAGRFVSSAGLLPVLLLRSHKQTPRTRRLVGWLE